MTTCDLRFAGGGRERPLVVVRHAGMRGMRLSVDPRDATVSLRLAPRAALKPALAWAAGKRDWVEAELARVPLGVAIEPGMTFALAGKQVTLVWDQGARRTPALSHNQIRIGGPADFLPVRLMRWLRQHALEVLTLETEALGAGHGIRTGRVGVGDPKGRWGSCTARGDIRYSWRLILAPDHVRRATVAHEVAHCVHMNHGPDFHALVAELNGGDPASARAWLRAHGTALHWFGCTG